MPTKDPRSYVQRIPPPTPSEKGSKNVTNFRRRQEQLTGQGFNALNYRPYVGIGDPFYLDEKRLVLSALGQLDESDDSYYTSSSDDDEQQRSEVATPYKSMTAAKFMLRRKKRELNNLNKEVRHGRTLIRNVKLGHGLFDLIKQERAAKKAAIAEVYRKKAEDARNAWQPPKSESSDDDDELPHDIELESNDYSGGEGDHIFITEPISGDGVSRPNSSKSTPRHKKKNVTPRPFTPKYTSLSEVTDHTQQFETNLTNSLVPTRDVSPETHPLLMDTEMLNNDNTIISFDVSRDSLFRQLCVLNWILEAMNLEHGYSMGPITSCWKLTKSDMGGNKVSTKKLQKDKVAQTNWDHFITNTGPHTRMSKRSSGPRLSRQYTNRRVQVRSSQLSPSNSYSQLNASNQSTGSHQLHPPGGTLLEDSTITAVQEAEEEETPYSRNGSTGIFKFLDEYYAGLKLPDGSTDPEKIDVYSSKPDHIDNSSSERHKREKRLSISDGRSSRKSHRKKSADRLSSKQERRDSRIQSAKTNSTEERRPSRVSIINSKIIRPKSSPGLIEYQSTLLSNKLSNLSNDLRNKFEEIQEDKALTLHEILQRLNRERLNKCQNKYAAMRPKTSIWLSLERMRDQGTIRSQTTEQLRKQSSFKGNWFTDLQESIPKQLTTLWNYKLILQKLARFGLLEISSNKSPYPFIKALGTLREWEICSPDITAAIEFCREKIVDMTVEEFEEWFQQQFPMITRPPTTSPISKSKEQKDLLLQATSQPSRSSRPATTTSISKVKSRSKSGH